MKSSPHNPQSLFPTRQKNRLHLSHYRGNRACFITIATRDRKAVFSSNAVVAVHLEVLEKAAAKHDINVLAYCYMPDHVHFLISGRSRQSDLFRFVLDYKQSTGYAHKRKTGQSLWQKSFYDHILRKDEDIGHGIRYILANPLRADLVKHPAAYPHSGSFVYGPEIFYESFVSS